MKINLTALKTKGPWASHSGTSVPVRQPAPP